MRGFKFYLLVVASLLLISGYRKPIVTNAAVDVNWPVMSKNGVWNQIGLSLVEQHFSDSMPGKLAKFSDGEKLYLLRYVTKTTRMLHPIVDCFKSSGYSISNTHEVILNEKKWYSKVMVFKENDRLVLEETIWDLKGNSWSDVSAWYWGNQFGASGPWYGCVIVSSFK